MRIPRIYVASPLSSALLVTLPASAARHVAKVLRLGPGARLVLFDGHGAEYPAVIESLRGARVEARVGAVARPARESPLAVTLVQGIARGERMDYTVQKAVELGVHAIQPVFSERSVVRLDATRSARRLAHWRQVALGACEQSGRTVPPDLRAPLRLPEWLAERPDDGARVLLDARGSRAFATLDAPRDRRLCLLVGPEGGLSESEHAAARARGFIGAALGPRVLRTETAALAALAVAQLLWGDFA